MPFLKTTQAEDGNDPWKLELSKHSIFTRYKEINGYVHDMAAAMFGGISTHAGLFGNAINVAKVMQMYIQNGNYGNKV